MIPGGMSEDGKGLYYQVVTLDNENINYQGDTILKYYSCANKGSTEVMDMERKIDYVYRTSTTEKLFMPYYRFYVEFPDMKHENGLNDYGAYYVPAVEGRYIENMPVWDGSFN